MATLRKHLRQRGVSRPHHTQSKKNMDNSTMFANLRQDLLEQIGEWLDSQTVTTEEVLAGIHGDPNEDDELHIKMADAAMKVYAESRELVFSS